MNKLLVVFCLLTFLTSLSAQVTTGAGSKGTEPVEDSADTEEVELAKSTKNNSKINSESEYQLLLISLGQRLVERDKICSPGSPKVDMTNFLQVYMKLVFTMKLDSSQTDCDEDVKYLNCLLSDAGVRLTLENISSKKFTPKAKTAPSSP